MKYLEAMIHGKPWFINWFENQTTWLNNDYTCEPGAWISYNTGIPDRRKSCITTTAIGCRSCCVRLISSSFTYVLNKNMNWNVWFYIEWKFFIFCLNNSYLSFIIWIWPYISWQSKSYPKNEITKYNIDRILYSKV